MVLSKLQEQQLRDRILYMAERGFPMTISAVREVAYHYVKVLHRRKLCELPETWKAGRMASLDWLDGFRKRNNDLSLRIAENISTSRAEAFNEERINTFFVEVCSLFNKLQLNDYPHLVYNCDETGLTSVPNKGKKVIAKKGTRTVQRIQTGERGTLTTLLPCINAAGEIIPPLLIFKGQGLPSRSDFPKDTKIFCSKSGYIEQEIFISFLDHFQEFRRKEDGKKCILFLDGHGSHLSVEAIEFCMENDIELMCLPPHSSHRIQPLDTHFNKPLKMIWAEELGKFLANNHKVTLTRYEFGQVFSSIWTTMAAKETLIRRSFAYCGLYPPRNPTTANDFVFASTYEEHRPAEQFVSAIRHVIPSPHKDSNPAHKRPHTAHITSPEHYEIKRQRKNKVVPPRPGRRLTGKSNSTNTNLKDIPHLQESSSKIVTENPSIKKVASRSSKITASKSIVIQKSNHAINDMYDPSTQGPSTMVVAENSRRKFISPTACKISTEKITHKIDNINHPNFQGSSSMVVAENRRRESTKNQKNSCCVCKVNWGMNNEDWFRCIRCEQWACESCFSVETCANC
jgi:hypothetical protein